MELNMNAMPFETTLLLYIIIYYPNEYWHDGHVTSWDRNDELHSIFM